MHFIFINYPLLSFNFLQILSNVSIILLIISFTIIVILANFIIFIKFSTKFTIISIFIKKITFS